MQPSSRSSKMLSLHPHDFNSNPCYPPYRSLAASSIHSEHSSMMSFAMGGAVQPPPTPQQERMELDGPLDAPRGPRCTPVSSSSSSVPYYYRHPELQQEGQNSGYYDEEEDDDDDEEDEDDEYDQEDRDMEGGHTTATSTHLSAATISPPADYNNLDPNLVAEALEVARNSPEGAGDPVVSGILESALSQLWERVLADPEGYVMTTGEFAVFNFYQHRFLGNKLAIAARRRFWDNTHA